MYLITKPSDPSFVDRQFDSLPAAEAGIAELEQTDPQGVANGDYEIDGPIYSDGAAMQDWLSRAWPGGV